jgi:uncharacterized membrane protein
MPSEKPTAAERLGLGHHVPLWRALRVRPRLAAALAFGIAVYTASALAPTLDTSARSLIGWNAGALLYLGLAWHQMRGVDDARLIQSRATSQDEGRITILLLVVVAAAAVMLAVGTQLAQVKSLDEDDSRGWHLALAGATVATSWFFTQVLFALHYAHDFYMARHRDRPDPLAFPGTRDPGYSDFFHFACVIGAAAQTADVAFQGRSLRPVGTLHCVLSFFFNTTLLALSMNHAPATGGAGTPGGAAAAGFVAGA